MHGRGSEQVAPAHNMRHTLPRVIRNDGDVPARILMWSTVVLPTASVYPDSDKIGVWTGNKADNVMVRRESGVEYFDRET